MTESLWSPLSRRSSRSTIIVSASPETPAGVRTRGGVEFAVNSVDEGSLGTAPETTHETAFQLRRLLVANHPFVDANRRPALNTTAVLCVCNGYRFAYDDDIRSILERLGTDEAAVDSAATVEYLASHTDETDLAAAIERLRDDRAGYGLTEPVGDLPDPNGSASRDGVSTTSTEEGATAGSPLDDTPDDRRRALVRCVAAADRETNRAVYDALETE
jgi:hypothetical protein